MRNISPFKEVASEVNSNEKTFLNALCERTGKITDSARKYMAPELIEVLVASIFEDADPITFINTKIVGKTLIYERAMIANAIRLKLGILRKSTQRVSAANEQLCTQMDGIIKHLDDFIDRQCALPFKEYQIKCMRINPHGRYDLMLYLFWLYREGKEEGVRRIYCDIIDTGLPSVANGYNAISWPVRAFLTYLKDTISAYKIDKFDFTEILLRHLTSKAEYGAASMVDFLKYDGITKDRVLQHITGGGDKNVSLHFVVNFLTRNRVWLKESSAWVKKRLLDFFREPHMTSVRKDAPAEHFHYMLCTCFDDQELRAIVPELVQFISEMVDPRTINEVMELADNDPDRAGLLDGKGKRSPSLALGTRDEPRTGQNRKRHDAAEDDGTAKKARSAAELAALASERAPAALSSYEIRHEAGKVLDRISPLKRFFVNARRNNRESIIVVNERALKILRNEQGYADGDSREYKTDRIIPNMAHRITKCVLSTGCRERLITELLKQKKGLSDLKLLASIVRVVTTTEVKSSGLEAGLIVPHGEALPREAQEWIDFLQINIYQQLKLTPGEFLGMYKDYVYSYDAIDYLFRDQKNDIQAVQARYEAILKAWCDEMNKGSDAFTHYVVSLINELEKAAEAKQIAQYRLRAVVLLILTTQANIKAVEALDKIVFINNKTEECILPYIMNPEHRHVSPYFVLQYISHIQKKLGRDDEWVLETQLAFFVLPARAADRQLMLINVTEILCRMRVKLLARLLYAYWKERALRRGLPRLFNTISRIFDPSVVGILVHEAGRCGNAGFIEFAQRGLLGLAVAAQMEESHHQRLGQHQQSGQNEDGGRMPGAMEEDVLIDIVGLDSD
ncbi:hypothetical protein PAPHI01_0443 [Pancytospora philotis]|nr:hypothetical protein PAPHI01_0443 [Pancytospora philotis]